MYSLTHFTQASAGGSGFGSSSSWTGLKAHTAFETSSLLLFAGWTAPTNACIGRETRVYHEMQSQGMD